MTLPPSPVISVIVRSQNRPCLADALASIAAQTWLAVEVVLVNTTAKPHPLPAFVDHTRPRVGLTVLNAEGSSGPLPRAKAINAGLQAATGRWALFLDDDDLLTPTHLARLASALLTSCAHKAAYAGVWLETAPEAPWVLLDEPYTRAALIASNFLPIHAVLFDMALIRENGLQCDEGFALFEDWDFWIALSCHTDFLHVPGGSALYRRWLGTSHHLGGGAPTLRRAQLTRLYAKWQSQLDAALWCDVVMALREKLDFWHDQTQHLHALHAATVAECQAQTEKAQHAHGELRRLECSLSWRITAPLRRLLWALRRKKQGVEPTPPHRAQ